MKVLHVIHALQQAAGTSFFCVELCRNLQRNGFEIIVVCSGPCEYPCKGVCVYNSDNLSNLGFVPDIVHIHGLWDFYIHRSMLWCQSKKIPYVISLHGCLMPNALHRSWWKKRIALNLYLKRDLLKAKLLHVTSTVELAAIKKLKINVPAMVIPLGCDAPSDISRICTNRRSMLFLSRISPEKGLKNLILAWAELSTEGWDLIIAGPDWRGHVAEIRNLVDARALRNIYFLGAVYGQEKDKLFRSADVFVLPSLTENFAAVVVEALSYGVPVITTTGTPWVVLEEEGCGWCAELTVASLKNKMKEALSTELPVLKAMGNKGRLFVEHNFAWPTIANRFVKLYTECVAVSENNI